MEAKLPINAATIQKKALIIRRLYEKNNKYGTTR